LRLSSAFFDATAVVVTPNGSHVYVPTWGSNFSVIDAATDTTTLDGGSGDK